MEDILSNARRQMDQVLSLVSDDLKSVKTGRARPNLIEDLKVEAYGSLMTLKELASISAPDSHSLIVSPWDKSILKEIEKGIHQSEVHLSPVAENDYIRIKIPPLTEETRKDLVKLVYQKLESGRKLLRQARNDAKEAIEARKGEPGVSEDHVKIALDKLQEQVNNVLGRIEEMGKGKEKELMTV